MKSRILLTVITVVLTAVFSTAALGQQTMHNPSGVFTPQATSSTAASNCGVTEEKLRQEGYIYKYTFKTESPAMSWVEGCSVGSLFRDTHGHAVAPGSACFLKAKESDECAFAGTCNNRAGLAFAVKADPVVDLTPPSATPAATPSPASPAPVAAELAVATPAAEQAVEFTPAPVITQYVPLSDRRAATAPAPIPGAAFTATTSVISGGGSVAKAKGGRHWVFKYTPLWCVDVRSKGEVYKPISCGLAALGGAYLSGLIGNRGVGSPAILNGFPANDWNNGPCSLWAVGGPYFGRRPIPARCF